MGKVSMIRARRVATVAGVVSVALLAGTAPVLAGGLKGGAAAGKGVLWLIPKLTPILAGMMARNQVVTPYTLADKIVTLFGGMSRVDAVKLAEFLLGNWVRWWL